MYLEEKPNMGQNLTTPLSLTLGHWKDIKLWADGQGMDVKKKKWWLLCTSEWLTLNSNWPKDGTFNLDTVLQIKEWVFSPGLQGHPDQIPYILTWESLAWDPPA